MKITKQSGRINNQWVEQCLKNEIEGFTTFDLVFIYNRPKPKERLSTKRPPLRSSYINPPRRSAFLLSACVSEAAV